MVAFRDMATLRSEVCSCCSYTVLPGPAWVLLNYVLRRKKETSVLGESEITHSSMSELTRLGNGSLFDMTLEGCLNLRPITIKNSIREVTFGPCNAFLLHKFYFTESYDTLF